MLRHRSKYEACWKERQIKTESHKLFHTYTISPPIFLLHPYIIDSFISGTLTINTTPELVSPLRHAWSGQG